MLGALLPFLFWRYNSSSREPGHWKNPVEALAPESTVAAWDAIPDALIAFDLHRRIVFLNAEATRYLGGRGLPLDGALMCRAVKVCDTETQTELMPERLPSARALQLKALIELENDHRRLCVLPERVSGWSAVRASLWERGQRNGCGRRFPGHHALQEARVPEMESTDQLRDFIYTGNLLGIVHSTVDGRILDCNEAVVRMLGYSSVAELRAIRAQQLYDEPLQRNEILRRVSASREIREAEVCFRCRDNSRCCAQPNDPST